jgi:hypothetical protein
VALFVSWYLQIVDFDFQPTNYSAILIKKKSSNYILVEIRFKRLNARSLISAKDFGRTNAKIGQNFSILPKLAHKTPTMDRI